MRNSLRKNAFFSGITNASDFIQFALILLAARMMEPSGFGLFCNAFSISMVFLTFSDLGLNQLSIRDVARDHSRAERYLGNTLTWKAILSVLAFGLLALTSFVIRGDEPLLRGVVVVMGLSIMLRFFTLTGRCFMQGFERFDIESLAVLIEQVLLVLFGTLVLMLGYGVLYFALAFLVTRCIGIAVSYTLLRRLVRVKPRFEPRFLFEKQVEAIPIGVVFGILMIYLHMDTLVLSSIATNADVGMYNSAFKIYNGLFMLPSILCTVLLPRLSHVHHASRHEFRGIMIKGVAVLLVASLPITIVGTLFSKQFIVFLFESDYAPAALPMAILFVTLTVSFQVWLLRTMYVATDRQRPLMIFYLAALGLRVAADLVLIPRHGITGAAVATLITEGFLFLGMWIYLLVSRRGSEQPESPVREPACAIQGAQV